MLSIELSFPLLSICSLLQNILETAPVASNVLMMLPTASSTDETMALRTTCSKWWKKKIYEMQLSGFDLEIKLAFA